MRFGLKVTYVLIKSKRILLEWLVPGTEKRFGLGETDKNEAAIELGMRDADPK